MRLTCGLSRRKEDMEAKNIGGEIRQVDAIVNRKKLKAEISRILGNALSGVEKYQYVQDKISYIRWGKVENDIHEAIDKYIGA